MRDDIVAAMMFGGACVVLVGAIVAWYKSQRRLRALEAQVLQPALAEDSRVEQLARAVESLSADVEQLASGQEFLQRVLTERQGMLSPRLPDAPKAVTPR